MADSVLSRHVESFDNGRALDEEFITLLKENGIPERGYLEQIAIDDLGISPDKSY